MEQTLWEACTKGDLSTVKNLLESNGEHLDVNWRDEVAKRSSFYRACSHNRVEVVKYLLTRKEVDINLVQHQNGTPLNAACQDNRLEVVLLLLRDPRCLVDIADQYSSTPLWASAQHGFLSQVKWILYLRPRVVLETKTMEGRGKWNNKTAREIAERNEHWEIATLLKDYAEDPLSVRKQLFSELKETPEGSFLGLAGEIFALVVFLCDDYFTLKEKEKEKEEQNIEDEKIERFWRIVKGLPMDLQMVLCNRIAGSSGTIIPKWNIERGLREVVKLFGKKEES